MMECSLEVLQAIYLKVVEASPDAMIVISDDQEIIVFNQQAEFMFGYDRSEVLGKDISVLLPEEVRDRHVHHVASYFDEPHTREMGTGQTLQGRHNSGKLFLVQIKLAPLIVPNAGTHVLAVIRRSKAEKKE